MATALLAGDRGGAAGRAGGGAFGDGIGVNDIGLDIDDRMREDSMMTHDDEIIAQTNVGQGVEKAKKRIREQVIRREKELRLDNLFLQDLDFLRNQSWAFLEEVHLTKNLINNIEPLNAFKSLRVIDASHNYIVEVNLQLPKLEQLILADNYLEKFPTLEHMKKLKTIDLNANALTGFDEVITEMTPNVRSLDLGHNQLFNRGVEDPNAEATFTAKLKEFKHLRKLVVQGNPFIGEPPDVKKQQEIIEQLNSLEYLDGAAVVEVRKKADAATQNAVMPEARAGRNDFAVVHETPGGGSGAPGTLTTGTDQPVTARGSHKATGSKG